MRAPIVIALVAACATPAPRVSPGPAVASPPPAPAAAAAVVAAVVPRAPAPAPAPPAVDPIATSGVDAALQLDAKGAAYDRAVAAAKAGDLAGARDQLAALAEHDLPLVTARLDSDRQLAALRAAPEAAGLRDRLAVIATTWSAAIAHGVPTIALDASYGEQAILHPRILRPGVWVASAHRFFPVTPPVAGAIAGWVDVAHQHAITVALDVDDCHSDFCPLIERIQVDVWSLTSIGVRIARSTYHTQGMTHGISVQSVDDGVRFQITDCGESGCKTAWTRLDATGAHRDHDQRLAADLPTLDIDVRGGALTLPAAGLAIDGRSLHAGASAPIELDKRHRLTAQHCVGANADHALVASTVDRCECGNPEAVILVHAIDVVDLTAGHAASLSIGAGWAYAELGPDGAAYVQIDRTVTRYPTLAASGTDPGERLPPGIVLATRTSGLSNCCGL